MEEKAERTFIDVCFWDISYVLDIFTINEPSV